jgi:hypothetical protein
MARAKSEPSSQSQSIFYLDINGRWLSDFVIFDLCTPEQH